MNPNDMYIGLVSTISFVIGLQDGDKQENYIATFLKALIISGSLAVITIIAFGTFFTKAESWIEGLLIIPASLIFFLLISPVLVPCFIICVALGSRLGILVKRSLIQQKQSKKYLVPRPEAAQPKR